MDWLANLTELSERDFQTGISTLHGMEDQSTGVTVLPRTFRAPRGCEPQKDAFLLLWW